MILLKLCIDILGFLANLYLMIDGFFRKLTVDFIIVLHVIYLCQFLLLLLFVYNKIIWL
jgi:hypothetical protein